MSLACCAVTHLSCLNTTLRLRSVGFRPSSSSHLRAVSVKQIWTVHYKHKLRPGLSASEIKVTKTFDICKEWHLTQFIKWCSSDKRGAEATLHFSVSNYLILIDIYLKEKFKEKTVSIWDNADKDNTGIKYSQGDNPQLMRCLNLDRHHSAPPL